MVFGMLVVLLCLNMNSSILAAVLLSQLSAHPPLSPSHRCTALLILLFDFTVPTRPPRSDCDTLFSQLRRQRQEEKKWKTRQDEPEDSSGVDVDGARQHCLLEKC